MSEIIYKSQRKASLNYQMNTFLLFPSFTGIILRLPIWGDPADDNCFDDEVYWEVSAHAFPTTITRWRHCTIIKAHQSRG